MFPNRQPVDYPALVLASASPRRADLMQALGLRFEVVPAHVVEWEEGDAPPDGLVRHNASLKAVKGQELCPGRTILAADTAVALDGEVFNKPADLAAARAMLKRLSGRTHTVYTGLALHDGSLGIRELHHVTSRVTFRVLDNDLIESYFSQVNPLDKAGAYGIQEGKEMIVESLDGSLSNVMGLPTEFLKQLLQRLELWKRFT